MHDPTARARRLAQWASASRLLAEHGPDISSYLRGEMIFFLSAGDRGGATGLLQVSEKILQLHRPPGDFTV
jgi:hypothetical protein